jgi:small subunit ribosomal protein S7
MRRPVKRKHTPQPDQKYTSTLVSQFINYLMQDGKKSVATRIVYHAMDKAGAQLKKTPLEALEGAVNAAGPNMELRSKRVGGANYQVPIEVRPSRRIALAFRWIINAARAATGAAMEERLAQELINANNGEGAAIKKKEDTHRMAEANRAFAHLAWGRK